MDGWKFGCLDGSVGGYMDGKLEMLLVGNIEVVQDYFTVYEMELAQAKLRDSFYPFQVSKSELCPLPSAFIFVGGHGLW